MCIRDSADCASRRKRSTRSSSAVSTPVIVLMATKRFRTGSWALYTSPIAPCPIRDTISYLPMRARSIRSPEDVGSITLAEADIITALTFGGGHRLNWTLEMSKDPTFRVLGGLPTRSERYEAYRKEWDRREAALDPSDHPVHVD